MGDKPLLWDEFDPALYRLGVRLRSSTGTDTKTVEIAACANSATDGTHFTINGRLVHLRGTVENCVFPLTGHAPMNETAWERIFRIALGSFGLNHMRFH